MTEMLNLMGLPFLACIVLIGIHAYFGIHVLKREVIFVDLALAQIAALGATVAFLFGIDPESSPAYVFSLVFITIAALIFALTRTREQRISQEAIIGIVYAVATAAAILVADRSPHGAEHIKEMLTGAILWVGPKTIALDAAVYAAVGLFHLACRRQFGAISENVTAAREAGIRVPLWDFLFYASFGVVVSLSVRVAGVLLVFCFLIVPAVISALFAEQTRQRLFLGWTLGAFVSLLGLLFSWAFDFPSGPAVACFFGLALVVSACLRYGGTMLDRYRERWGTGKVKTVKFAGVTGVAVAALVLVMAPAVRREPPGIGVASPVTSHHGGHHNRHHHSPAVETAALLHALSAAEAAGRRQAAMQIADRGLRSALPELMTRVTAEDDDDVRAEIVEALVRIGDKKVVAALKEKLKEQQPPGARVAIGKVLLELGDRSAVPALIDLLKDDSVETIKYRQAAVDELRKAAGTDFGYDVLGNTAHNRKALAEWQAWWRRQGKTGTHG